MERAARIAYDREWNKRKELQRKDNLRLAHKVFVNGVWHEKGRPNLPKRKTVFRWRPKF